MNRALPKICAIAAAVASLGAHAQTPTLPTVEIRGEGESYVQPNGTTATRDAAPIVQVPQSVIVVPRKLIEDQGAQTVTDALRNVSNVRHVDLRDFYNIQFKVRGFNAATLIDGQAMPSNFSNLESTVNVESIEVLKGPAPAISGGGQTAGSLGFLGGAIAITTKSPEPNARREIGFRLGNWSERGVFFDLNQPINETVGVRLVGESQHNGSESNGAFFKRSSLFPSLVVRPGGGSELLLKMRFSRLSNLDYSGLPPEGTILPALWTLPRSLNITATGQPVSSSKVDGWNLQWKQPISANWSYEVALAQSSSVLDQNGVFTDDFFFPNPGPFYLLTGLNLTQRVKSTTLSATLKGQADLAGVKHKLALGVDVDRTTDYGYMAGALGGLGLFDITNPVPPVWVAPVPNLPGAQDNTYASSALFLQDRVTLGNNLHLLGALRYTSIKVRNLWPDFGVNSTTTNSKLTPRLGAVYEFTPVYSAFVGYGAGMSIPTNGIYTTPPKPEGSKQTEIGFRSTNPEGLNATVALFSLTRTNAPVADPLNFGQTIQTGEQRSTGVDIDWNYKASKALTWFGHYTRQNPRVTQDTVLAVGSQLFNVARTSARVAFRYDFRDGALRGLGAGLGATYHSALPGNSANAFFTPAVTVWDAQLSYVAGGARYQLALRNLLDKQYYEPSAYFGGNHVTPATRRQISLTASYAF
ncbi:MAG: TonB-dependent receptor [Ramlibacter sp.]|jgi:iron complex outermembrane receptor protein|nr:TonB-dependent receptor [Ramlibacter sp.]